MLSADIPGRSIAISRDGAQVAYVVAFGSGEQFVVRGLGDLRPRAIASAEVVRQPFFSPDGKWIGYFGRDSLRKISLEGGRPVALVSALSNSAWVRGSWSDDGRIVYDTWNAGLRVVSADGGEARVLTQPEEEWHLGPASRSLARSPRHWKKRTREGSSTAISSRRTSKPPRKPHSPPQQTLPVHHHFDRPVPHLFIRHYPAPETGTVPRPALAASAA